MTRSYCITDKTDIFVYFEIIRQTGAKSVLDVGCFLKRIGALSRSVGDISLPEDIRLDSTDLVDAPKLPVYDTVYDGIFEKIPTDKKYDLVMALDIPDEPDKRALSKCGGSLFCDAATYKKLTRSENLGRGVQDVTVDDRVYKLITF